MHLFNRFALLTLLSPVCFIGCDGGAPTNVAEDADAKAIADYKAQEAALAAETAASMDSQ